MAQHTTQRVSRQTEQAHSAVERMAAFAFAARPEQLKPNLTAAFKRTILDSLSGAIAALPGPLFRALRGWRRDFPRLVKEHTGYEGGLDKPMSWNRVVEKFRWLSEAFADGDLRSKLIGAVEQLDARPISSLMDLLAQVRPSAVYPRTRAGI